MQSLVDYTPRNSAFSLSTVQQQAADLTEAEEAEVIAWRAYEMARERATNAGITFHATMQGVKVEVVAQYGEDSPAVHAIGLKRKSERARPPRRKPVVA